MANDDFLAKYIEKVSEIKDKTAGDLSHEDMRQVARDLLVTDAELARVDAYAKESLTRGKNFVEYKCWPDAVRELSTAALLMPEEADAHFQLGKAHFGLFQQTGALANLKEAEQYARHAIQLDPHSTPAFELLKDIQESSNKDRNAPRPAPPPAGPPAAPRPRRSLRRKLFKIIILVAGVVLAFQIVRWAAPGVMGPHGDLPRGQGSPRIELPAIDYPVQFQSLGDLGVTVKSSRVWMRMGSETGSRYVFEGTFRNNGKTSITALSLRFMLPGLIFNGEANKETLELIKAGDPPLKPGESVDRKYEIALNGPAFPPVTLEVVDIKTAP
jgi:hypothetical protein